MSKKHVSPAPVTEIAFILDRSGSMSPHTEAAIAGFNEFLLCQQEVTGIARLTLVLFDDRYEVPASNLPVGEVIELDTRTYTTRGSTALLDAIGRTIVSFETRHRALPPAQRPAKVVFAIFTDGEENSSKHFSWQDLARKIQKRQEKDGWEFLFLAANQDAIATAAQMNIHARNAATASVGEKGVRGSAKAFGRKVGAIREACGSATLSADYDMPLSEILREEEEGL